MQVNHLFLFCENSYLAEFPYYGILPAHSSENKIDYQKKRIISFNEKYPDPCPNTINHQKLSDEFAKECYGKNSCFLRDFHLFIEFNELTPAGCRNNDTAEIFIQVKCYQKQEWINYKKPIILGLGCLGIFGCMVFLIVFYYRLLANTVDFKLWDMKTETIDDFTVELKITDQLMDDFYFQDSLQSKQNS